MLPKTAKLGTSRMLQTTLKCPITGRKYFRGNVLHTDVFVLSSRLSLHTFHSIWNFCFLRTPSCSNVLTGRLVIRVRGKFVDIKYIFANLKLTLMTARPVRQLFSHTRLLIVVVGLMFQACVSDAHGTRPMYFWFFIFVDTTNYTAFVGLQIASMR